MPYPSVYPATYAESPPTVSGFPLVYPWIARCLQDAARNVDDVYFDDPIRSVLRDSLAQAAVRLGYDGSLALYSSLTGDDLARVSEAVGLIVAADWQPSLATGGAGGELTSEKTPEGASRAFASAETLRQSWRDRAKMLLESCAFTPPRPTGLIPSFFGANGPSRTRAMNGGCR